MASAIKEGLICAECHAEFNSVSVLLAHYQTHSQEESKSIKGLIDKAKSRLVNKQEEVIRTTPKYYDIYEDVPLGRTRSHLDNFKRLRSSQVERLSSEASKLIIRLHKLTSFEGEENKRRAFEQTIVQWMDEKLVNRCPDCAESFNLLLRKHHCRICGSILCENCSVFIGSTLAASLLTSQIANYESIHSEYLLRTCQYCNNLVRMKGSAVDPNPPISQLYEKLKQLMSHCEALNMEYSNMISSLGRGDNLYSKEQVTAFRNDLIKHTEKIDLLSKRIILLGVDTGEPISDSENRLRSRLRMSTINWIRDFLSGISVVPEKEKPVDTLGDGWTPSIDNNQGFAENEEDVVAIQIKQMKKWIAEAKKANRTDEVEMLQTSLAEFLRIKNEG